MIAVNSEPRGGSQNGSSKESRCWYGRETAFTSLGWTLERLSNSLSIGVDATAQLVGVTGPRQPAEKVTEPAAKASAKGGCQAGYKRRATKSALVCALMHPFIRFFGLLSKLKIAGRIMAWI